MPRCLIALGANLGDAHGALMQAAEEIDAIPGVRRLQVSRLFESAAVGGPAGQPRFVNAVAVIEAGLPPHELLAALHGVEQRFGRTRRDRWDARTLDLDLLLYGDRVSRDDHIQTPHPRMSFRPFVMAPAAEIAADWIHPLLGRSLAELNQLRVTGSDQIALAGLPDSAASLVRGCVGDRVMTSCEAIDPAAAPPRLSIAPADAGPLTGAGPTLWLPEDASPEELRQEVNAAIECVWGEERPGGLGRPHPCGIE